MTPSPAPIRVLVADDTATVRLLLRRTLESSNAFEVVGEAADGAEAVDLAATLQPDMVLLDLSMPVLSGMQAIPRIRRCAPDAQVVVLSSFTPEHMGAQAINEGAAAFLEKQQRPDDLVASLLQTWHSSGPTPGSARQSRPKGPARWAAFDDAPLATAVVVGPDDRVRYANPALCRLSGYGPDELLTLTVSDLTHPDDREAACAARRSVAVGAAPSSTAEARLVRPDGRTVWASISSAPTTADDGDDPCLVLQLVDVSEHRQVIGELTRSNAELSSFAYLAAHELKSPLQAVSGFSSLLEKVHGPQLDPQGREFIAWIVDAASRMDVLVETLLSYCAVDTAETVLAPVGLDEVTAEALVQLDGEVRARNAVVTVEPLPLVTGDPVQVGQLLQNLLANALKFVPSGRRPLVHVSAARDTDAWTVTVADNGIGVDSEAQERIFAMFERLHPQDRFKGTGIGLSICKRIVERRGGTIWVEPNPSGGSCFRFRLPDVVAASRSMPAA